MLVDLLEVCVDGIIGGCKGDGREQQVDNRQSCCVGDVVSVEVYNGDHDHGYSTQRCLKPF